MEFYNMKAGQCAKIGFNGIERGPSGSFFHDALNNTKSEPQLENVFATLGSILDSQLS